MTFTNVLCSIVNRRAEINEAIQQNESSDDPYVAESKKEYEELPHKDVYIYHPTLQMKDSLITETVSLQEMGAKPYITTKPLPKTPEEVRHY